MAIDPMTFDTMPTVPDFSMTIEVLRLLSAIFDCAGDAQRAGADEMADKLLKFADRLGGQFLNPIVFVRED